MHWRAWHFPFEPALKLCEHSAAPATARRSSTIKRLASPNAPKSSLNSNSIRLLLCVFVSFRSHLAITGANLWSAPGYSVKMTDFVHASSPLQNPSNLPSSTRLFLPPGRVASLPQVSPLLLAHGCHKFDFLMKNQCFECLPLLSPFKGKIV